MTKTIQTLNKFLIAHRDALIERLLQSTGGLFDIFTFYIGDRLDFYQELAGGEALTSVELASRNGTQEHYVREWLEQHTVTDILLVDERGNQ